MNKLRNLILLVSVVSTVAFTAPMRTVHDNVGVATMLRASPGDFPPEEAEEYTGTVDWDAEWKKVVASEGKTPDGSARPGKDFYKSEAEIAAIKAANKVAEGAVEASSRVVNSMPDIRSLSGDWKFWIGILAVVSVGLSLLSAPPAEMVPPSDGSYFI